MPSRTRGEPGRRHPARCGKPAAGGGARLAVRAGQPAARRPLAECAPSGSRCAEHRRRADARPRPCAGHRGPATASSSTATRSDSTGSSPTSAAATTAWRRPRVGRGDLRHRRATHSRPRARMAAEAHLLVTVSWSLQRTQHGEQPVWLALAGRMLGQIGLPGGGFGHGYGSMADVGAPSEPSAGRLCRRAEPGHGPHPGRADRRHAAAPGRPFDYDGRRLTYPDIRLVYWAGGNPFHHHQDLDRLRRAFGAARHGRRPRAVLDGAGAARRHRAADDDALERNDIGGRPHDDHLIAMHRPSSRTPRHGTTTRSSPALAERLGVGEASPRAAAPRDWLEHLYEAARAGGASAAGTCRLRRVLGAMARSEMPAPDRGLHPDSGIPGRPGGAPRSTPRGRIEMFSETIDASGTRTAPAIRPGWSRRNGSAQLRHALGLQLIANQPGVGSIAKRE